MSELFIQDSDGNELRFEGQLASETEKELTFDDGYARKFIARIYAVDGGGFVPSLQYESSSPSEKPIIGFEEIDFMDDVEKFFYVFEPSEIFSDSSDLPRDVIEQRPALGKQLAKDYETMVFALLDDFRAKWPNAVFSTRLTIQPHEKSRRFGVR